MIIQSKLSLRGRRANINRCNYDAFINSLIKTIWWLKNISKVKIFTRFYKISQNTYFNDLWYFCNTIAVISIFYSIFQQQQYSFSIFKFVNEMFLLHGISDICLPFHELSHEFIFSRTNKTEFKLRLVLFIKNQNFRHFRYSFIYWFYTLNYISIYSIWSFFFLAFMFRAFARRSQISHENDMKIRSVRVYVTCNFHCRTSCMGDMHLEFRRTLQSLTDATPLFELN